MNKTNYTRQGCVSLMRMQKNQRNRSTAGVWLPATEGSTIYAENVRKERNGYLQSSEAAKKVAETGRHLLLAERRCDDENLLSIDNERNLYFEGRVSDNGEYTAVEELLGQLPEEAINGCVQVGEFVVISIGEGELWYVLWHPDLGSYTLLGALPELPSIDVEMCECTTLSGTAESVEFGEGVSDMRSGVPSDVKSKVAQSVLEGYRAIEERALQSGLWTEPVAVRVGMRLWDGSLLGLSEPIIAQGMTWQGSERVILPLVQSDDLFTGTSSGSITLDGYKLRVRTEANNLGAWRYVIKNFEIWVSSQPDVYGDLSATSVGYGQSDGVRRLGVVLSLRGRQGMMHELVGVSMRRAAIVEAGSGATETVIRRSGTALIGSPGSESFCARELRSQVIASHGGYLHLSGISYGTSLSPLPKGYDSASADCRVAVELSALGGVRRVVYSGTINASEGSLMPVLWYPSRMAQRITVSLKSDGRMYESTFELTTSDEEDAAYALADEIGGFKLTECTEWSKIEESADVSIDKNMLLTMKRGNPFILAYRSESVGGEVSAIVAQPSGGGAYTRQYLYLLTDRGILALTHDKYGEHTNIRSISGERVKDVRHAISCGSGVAMVSSIGNLLFLNDSKVQCAMRGMPEIRFMHYDDCNDELWLFPTEGNGLALSVESISNGVCEGSMRTFDASGSIGSLLIKGDERVTAIFQPYGGGMERSVVTTVSDEPQEGGLSLVWLQLLGDTDVSAELLIESAENLDAMVLGRLKIDGMKRVATPMATVLPAKGYIGSYGLQLTLRGKFAAYGGFGISKYNVGFTKKGR